MSPATGCSYLVTGRRICAPVTSRSASREMPRRRRIRCTVEACITTPNSTRSPTSMVGADDEFTPVSEARLMADRIPDCTLAVIDGAAHMPDLEGPQQFNKALAAFLKTL
ncbi:MAG: alpha/beta hydrolase [Actinomycetota bacterium]|nr:alpha/beta hydrolase [Actinomycetota bacterium]